MLYVFLYNKNLHIIPSGHKINKIRIIEGDDHRDDRSS